MLITLYSANSRSPMASKATRPVLHELAAHWISLDVDHLVFRKQSISHGIKSNASGPALEGLLPYVIEQLLSCVPNGPRAVTVARRLLHILFIIVKASQRLC